MKGLYKTAKNTAIGALATAATALTPAYSQDSTITIKDSVTQPSIVHGIYQDQDYVYGASTNITGQYEKDGLMNSTTFGNVGNLISAGSGVDFDYGDNNQYHFELDSGNSLRMIHPILGSIDSVNLGSHNPQAISSAYTDVFGGHNIAFIDENYAVSNVSFGDTFGGSNIDQLFSLDYNFGDNVALGLERYTIPGQENTLDNQRYLTVKRDLDTNLSYLLDFDSDGNLSRKVALGDHSVIRDVSYDANTGRIFFGGGGGNQGFLMSSSYEAVPEPSTYALLFGAGALGAAVAMRRKRQKSLEETINTLSQPGETGTKKYTTGGSPIDRDPRRIPLKE